MAGGPDYAGKPRPVVIVQENSFADLTSVTICGFTTDPTNAPLFRLRVEPTSDNGLTQPSSLMADKITTVPRAKLGRHIGHLEARELGRLNQAMLLFLGLAGSSEAEA